MEIKVESQSMASTRLELQSPSCFSRNPSDFEIEKLSNVPGKLFRRKRWRARNGMGFVRFMYEGQIAYARVCGRDFLMKSSDDWLTGSLPPLQSNQEIDITMELHRMKKPGFWPQLDSVNFLDPDTLIYTEFVAPVAWIGVRPFDESVIEAHVKKAEVDLFRLPKEFVEKISEDQNGVGYDSTMDATSGDISQPTAKDCFPLPKEASYYNQSAVVVRILSNFLMQLEIVSGPNSLPNLVGRKLFASRNRFYTEEGVVMKPKMTFDNYISLGSLIHCDISQQMFDEESWVATLAWLGGLTCKPDIDTVHWHHHLNRTSQRGKIMTLESNLMNNGAVGGLIYNLDSAERAIFDRKNVYLFGTCLAKMDLNCVLNLSDKVKLVTEPLELDELQKFKEKYGGLEVYKRAKIVWVGETPKYQFVNDPQLKYSVDKNLTGLQQYLAKRNISMEMFANVLVTGQETAKSIPAGPPLMAASDLRGQVIELKRPDCGNLKKDTVNGILQVSSGALSGKLAFFPRHCLHLFGHNMHNANLMDIVHFREEFNVELIGGTNNKSVPYSVRAAWIGQRPTNYKHNINPRMGHCASNSSSNGAITAENTALFKTWISKHKSIKNEEEFLSKCVNGGRVPNPFFPFQSSEVQSAKILFLDDSGPKGVQAGVLLVTKGTLEKQTVIFESNSVFLHCVHFENGDLSYVLKEGDKVTAEVTEFTGGKERKRIYSRVKAVLDKLVPLPSHYAQLVYVGSRPKPQNCCPNPPLSEENVSETPNLRLWLQKRNITCGFFSTLIRGEVPPKPIPDASIDIVPKIDKNPFAKANSSPIKYNNGTSPMVQVITEGPLKLPRETMAVSEAGPPPLNAVLPREPPRVVFSETGSSPNITTTTNVLVPRESIVVSKAGPSPTNLVPHQEPMAISEGPPNVPREIVIETLAQTDALIRRIMKCTSPDDPQLKDVINSKEDLQLANFLSKSLNSAIFHFHEKSSTGDKKDACVPLSRPQEVKHSTTSTLFPIGHPRSQTVPFHEEHRLPILRQTSTNQYDGRDAEDSQKPENSMIPSVAATAATPTNYQNRGLCGLREPLLNYQQQDQFRQRRRSGDQFRNEIPFKRKFHLHQNQELRHQQW